MGKFCFVRRKEEWDEGLLKRYDYDRYGIKRKIDGCIGHELN